MYVAHVFLSGTNLSYNITIKNTGNVKLRDLVVAVPVLSSNTTAGVITCTQPLSDGTPTAWNLNNLAAAQTLTCTGSYSFKQMDIESGSINLTTTVTAANMAAAIEINQPVPLITIPNLPSLNISLDTNPCSIPEQAGELCEVVRCFSAVSDISDVQKAVRVCAESAKRIVP